MQIAALEQCDTGVSCFELGEHMFPLALVVGNEITGVSDKALALCDTAVEIPMLGMKHSLNVAVATGIVVFECVRIVGAAL
jgi:tRNA G18 (ribose-2'-O)-methylase SpoU